MYVCFYVCTIFTNMFVFPWQRCVYSGPVLLHHHGILRPWAALRGATGWQEDHASVASRLVHGNCKWNELFAPSQNYSSWSQITQVSNGANFSATLFYCFETRNSINHSWGFQTLHFWFSLNQHNGWCYSHTFWIIATYLLICMADMFRRLTLVFPFCCLLIVQLWNNSLSGVLTFYHFEWLMPNFLASRLNLLFSYVFPKKAIF